jgi:hypothetical protein
MVKIFEVYSYDRGGSRPIQMSRQVIANDFLCECDRLGIRIVNATPEDGYYTIIIDGNEEQLRAIREYSRSTQGGVDLLCCINCG